jgi:hypothetical protein
MLSKTEVSDLKSLIEAKVRRGLQQQNANLAFEQASRNLEDFLWRQEHDKETAITAKENT